MVTRGGWRPARRIDDALHPTLSKGRRLDQLLLDRLGDGPGRSHYGTTEVQEMEAASALNPFAAPDGSSEAAWSLNPYVGCAHRCAYCYVPDTIMAQRERWGSYVIVKRNLPTVLGHELKRRPRARVYLCTGTDPYQPVEEEHRITRKCLELLGAAGWPVDLLTRSPLVLRDLDLLASMGDRLRVGLSIPTLDDAARRAIEPAAPPIPARLDALRQLADAGLTTYANLAPAYPLTGGVTPGAIARAFAKAGVAWVNTSPWRYRRSVLPVVAARLRGGPFEDLVGAVANERQQRRLSAALEVAFEREALPLRTGFFNPPGPAPGERPDATIATV
ncbi:MAG: SPL family radical SAM protein [Thermoplasmatota archaeon]